MTISFYSYILLRFIIKYYVYESVFIIYMVFILLTTMKDNSMVFSLKALADIYNLSMNPFGFSNWNPTWEASMAGLGNQPPQNDPVFAVTDPNANNEENRNRADIFGDTNIIRQHQREGLSAEDRQEIVDTFYETIINSPPENCPVTGDPIKEGYCPVHYTAECRDQWPYDMTQETPDQGTWDPQMNAMRIETFRQWRVNINRSFDPNYSRFYSRSTRENVVASFRQALTRSLNTPPEYRRKILMGDLKLGWLEKNYVRDSVIRKRGVSSYTKWLFKERNIDFHIVDKHIRPCVTSSNVMEPTIRRVNRILTSRNLHQNPIVRAPFRSHTDRVYQETVARRFNINPSIPFTVARSSRAARAARIARNAYNRRYRG